MTGPFAPPKSLIQGLRSGRLEVRLAAGEDEIRASQALRYRVFYEEMAARPSPEMARLKRDFDRFDGICDHLLVFDHDVGTGVDAVVGTYRLFRRAVAEAEGGFYTASEFDIAGLVAMKGEILELGRSCVDRAHRNRPTMQLLWAGIAAYVFHHDIVMMFGCASLPGTDPEVHAEALSYLYHQHLAPPEFRPRALEGLYVPMNRRPFDSLDARRVLASLPPLIKGYLRLGGFVGDGAVIDEQFNTTDVCIMVKTDLVTSRYVRHYGRASGVAAES